MHACADDLASLVKRLGVAPRCVIGHSFGGKVALAYGQRNPLGLRDIWSLDSDPGLTRGDTVSSVTAVIDGIRSAPVPVAHRLAIRNHFDDAGFAPLRVQIRDRVKGELMGLLGL